MKITSDTFILWLVKNGFSFKGKFTPSDKRRKWIDDDPDIEAGQGLFEFLDLTEPEDKATSFHINVWFHEFPNGWGDDEYEAAFYFENDELCAYEFWDDDDHCFVNWVIKDFPSSPEELNKLLRDDFKTKAIREKLTRPQPKY